LEAAKTLLKELFSIKYSSSALLLILFSEVQYLMYELITITQLSLLMYSDKPTVETHAHIQKAFEVEGLLEGVVVHVVLVVELVVVELDHIALAVRHVIVLPQFAINFEEVLQHYVAVVHASLVHLLEAELLASRLNSAQN
jgi:hypothetical protein